MIGDIFAAAGRVAASVATMHYVRSLLTLLFVAVVVFAVGHPSLVAVLATYLIAAFLQFVVALRHSRRDIAMFQHSGGLVSTLRNTLGQGIRLFSLEFSQFMMVQGTIWLAIARVQSGGSDPVRGSGDVGHAGNASRRLDLARNNSARCESLGGRSAEAGRPDALEHRHAQHRGNRRARGVARLLRALRT